MMDIRKNTVHTYGNPPFTIAVVHGGPGAAGEMAPVARELAGDWNVLEPIQTALSVEGQVEELAAVIRDYGDQPVILIGFSWGAWLSFIMTARYPYLVKKLILVGTPPFEDRYAYQVQATRLQRLDLHEQSEYHSILEGLKDPADSGKNHLLNRLRELTRKTDTLHPIENGSADPGEDKYNGAAFAAVWDQAAELRHSGALLDLATQIKCPVTAIHGDYDPHPAEGVEKPLSTRIKNFRFILLEQCGHKPWIEQHARDSFFQILKKKELA
jgi:pimeloyl-ACP methyl ester carboxylesterase